MTQFFILWDQAFIVVVVHTVDPRQEKDCKKVQDLTDQAIATARKMNMPITLKGHGIEAHVDDQRMRFTPGGISMMIEHWLEMHHQVGFKYDDKWRLLKDEAKKSNLRAHREYIIYCRPS